MGSIAQDVSAGTRSDGWHLETEHKRYADKFRVIDKELAANYERLVAHKRTSNQGKSEEGFTETYKSVQKSLDDLNNRIAKNGVKLNKPTYEYFDENAKCETLSSQIKERFTMLNLNLLKEVPEDFKIYVDCQQFHPNELKVTVKDGCVVVHGKHDVKLDEHGLIKREFTRSWSIPEDVEFEKFGCFFDRHGILTIRAPRKPTSITVPIQIEQPQTSKDSASP